MIKLITSRVREDTAASLMKRRVLGDGGESRIIFRGSGDVTRPFWRTLSLYRASSYFRTSNYYKTLPTSAPPTRRYIYRADLFQARYVRCSIVVPSVVGRRCIRSLERDASLTDRITFNSAVINTRIFNLYLTFCPRARARH